MLAPNRRRKGSSLKRDIFAVMTFVATGFLFYLIQAHDPTQNASEKVSGVTEQVSIEGTVTETPVGIRLKEGGSRDS
jgi:hypothetical protein